MPDVHMYVIEKEWCCVEEDGVREERVVPGVLAAVIARKANFKCW